MKRSLRRVLSSCLIVLLAFSMMTVKVHALGTEKAYLDSIEGKIKRSSRATITDAEGNVLEMLEVDVHVQQIATSKSSNEPEYMITCIARSINNDDYSDDDTQDGYIGILNMVCKDVFGKENQLISVSGNFSGGENDTKNRTVTYAAYNSADIEISSITKNNLGLSYIYTPVDYTGFTFRAWSSAEIVETGNKLEMYVSTDAL